MDHFERIADMVDDHPWSRADLIEVLLRALTSEARAVIAEARVDALEQEIKRLRELNILSRAD